MTSRYSHLLTKDTTFIPPVLEKDEDATHALELILETTSIASGRYCTCNQRMSPTFKDDQPEYLDSDFLLRF